MKQINKNAIANQTDSDDQVKVFHGLRESKIQRNHQLLELLDLNAEQLGYYLANISEANPYINCDNSSERHIEYYRKNRKKTTRQYKELTLNDYLKAQIDLYNDTPIREVMYQLIDYLDEDGYIPYTHQDLAERLDYPEMVVLDGLTLFQRLEPTGVGAYNMQEAMLVQIDMDQYAPEYAYQILKDYYQEVQDLDLVEIQKQTNLSQDQVQACLDYYMSLRPAPATLFDRQDRINLIPDITIRKADEKRLVIRYNRQYIPKLSFNNELFRQDLEKAHANGDKIKIKQIQSHRSYYRNLLANLRYREDLLGDVSKILAQNQAKYILGLEDQPVSLTISNLAQQARLSVQLIYKIINEKNVEVNGYVYAMTDFINITNYKPNPYKGTDIPSIIQEIVENSSRDLTDLEITQILKNNNIDISEQVVANYRRGLK